MPRSKMPENFTQLCETMFTEEIAAMCEVQFRCVNKWENKTGKRARKRCLKCGEPFPGKDMAMGPKGRYLPWCVKCIETKNSTPRKKYPTAKEREDLWSYIHPAAIALSHAPWGPPSERRCSYLCTVSADPECVP